MDRKKLIDRVVYGWLSEVCSEGMLYGPGHPKYEEYVAKLNTRNAIRVEEASILRRILEEELDASDKEGHLVSEALFFARKKDTRRMAVGVRVKALADKGQGTLILNDQSFSVYNYELTNEEIQAVVDSQDEVNDFKANLSNECQDR